MWQKDFSVIFVSQNPDLELVNTIKISRHLVELVVPEDDRVKNERMQKERPILGSCQREEKKLWNVKVTVGGRIAMVLYYLERRLV